LPPNLITNQQALPATIKLACQGTEHVVLDQRNSCADRAFFREFLKRGDDVVLGATAFRGRVPPTTERLVAKGTNGEFTNRCGDRSKPYGEHEDPHW